MQISTTYIFLKENLDDSLSANSQLKIGEIERRKLYYIRGITGLETAFILVALVITAAAFAFFVLNMRFLTAEKAQSVISSGMSEVSSALLVDSGGIGQFGSTGGDQAYIARATAS